MRKYFALFAILIFAYACKNSNKFDITTETQTLSASAKSINNDFKTIRHEVENLAREVLKLYEKQNEILPTIDPKKYKINANGVMFKPVDDGGSAVFVSGCYPLNDEIKRIVYFTEPIDAELKRISGKYNEVSQSYYNDKYSYNRIYPYFDVLSQYEAGMNIPDYNFYLLADAAHNPERKSLWVTEPYVDPAGRGWMVSAIAPVYYKNELVGVPGIDVTINQLTKRYILENPESMTMIIDSHGNIVAAQDMTINLLSFPPLFDHKYIETIKQDTYRKENYNLLLSRDLNVRKIGEEILKKNKNIYQTQINGEDMTIISAKIPELNWYIIEILR